MQVTRRDFLTFTGFTLAGITLGEWGRSKILAKEGYKDGLYPGIGKEEFRLSICGQCLAGCGIVVRLVDGLPKKIDGNPLCPISRGKLCPKGQNGLQVLYDPDRLTGPVKRKGKRGENDWGKISWEEAIDTVSQKLKELKEKQNSHKLLILAQENRGLAGKLWKQFAQTYGTPNLVEVNLLRDPGILWASYLMQGIKDYPAYDIENAKYILSFSPLLEGWYSPTWLQRMYGNFRRKRPEIRGKLVQIEPRLSPTGANADEWIQINPGTEAALVLGLAYLIIKEGRFDEDFIREHTFGFDDWTDAHKKIHLGFKNFVIEEYDTEKVSSITGVPIVTIIRLAREFSELKPALAIAEQRPASGGFYLQMAILALNALVGNLDTKGGTLIQREIPFKEFPEVSGSKKESILNPENFSSREVFPHLTKAILEEKPYPIEALLIDKINPLSNCFPVGNFNKTLEKIPFIVSFSPFLDETSLYADLILPDHTFLEKWQDLVPPSTFGSPTVGVTKPAVEPFLDTKNTVDVLLEISHRQNNFRQDSLPWKTYEELLQDGLKGVYESRRGMLYGTSFQGTWMGQMEKGGWWSPTYTNFEEFWNQLLEKGGWWDPFYEYQKWDRVFKTPSRKFEFYSQILKNQLASTKPSKEDPDLKILPHWESVVWEGDENSFPLSLNVFELLTFSALLNPNQPYLYEHITPHLSVQWENWVEIHPEKAKALGIEENDEVWVESVLGKIKTKAKLYFGTHPEVVSLPLGLSGLSHSSWIKKEISNPNQLALESNGNLENKYLRVKVYRA